MRSVWNSFCGGMAAVERGTITRRAWLAVSILSIVMLLAGQALGADSPKQAGWKAGIARANITPDKPIWLAGYGGRTHPAEGKMHDLWIKVLALEDARH